MWLGPGADEAEHLANTSLNSCLEKEGHSIKSTWGSLLRKMVLMGLFSAGLYDEWRACHSSGRVLQDWFLYEINLMVGRNFFLTQFIRSQGLLFEKVILNIFSLKNFLLAIWIFDLNSFQCWMSSEARYLFRLVVQSELYYSLECFVIHFILEWVCYALLQMVDICWTTFSRVSFELIFVVLRVIILLVIELIKFSSSSLSLPMVCKGDWGTRLQENPQLILQFVITIQLTSRRILRD